ncbi:alkylmercury lyase [Halobiforma lacisalsi AJ5]|uniref:Alkylmercury lyase n=1 Tax=Natronobacterium lacisalsi AJ5 TaxID=358396 RepID=M0LMF5_NATLA|nr:organomercurial lyase [Halobiforma lacisalsi]APW96972.1 alkylmercury lyase [Halobiforma lacisalsi AJ5]EMA34686.1 alkylmercury lyase [Halobiforma lacisalsi AJ5]
MANDRPDCSEPDVDERTATPADGTSAERGRWLPDRPEPALEAPLPDELGTALGRLVGTNPVATLGEWVEECRRLTGGAIALEELCHADGETAHWGELGGAGGERYDFQCVYDAVILAAVADEPVRVHTESPDGTPIEARATGDEVTATPPSAVVSFGVEADVDRPGGGADASIAEPTLEDVYATVCPYVRAFPDREAYDRWASRVSAATVAMPLAGATDLAEALVE